MMLRGLESRLRSVTGGNGAIYATRRESYIVVDPIMGHDLSFPFNLVKRGWRCVYVPEAEATEKMVPTIEGEFARKRRMMSHGWPIVLRGGMLSPRGYGPTYALMIFSHRVLRYVSPFIHLVALATNLALLGQGPLYVTTAAIQLAILLAAALASVLPFKPFLIARYYVLTTASLAAGLWDWLRQGTDVGWEPAQGTR
jgi:cellulose synthase/poly-beta-1,6-N-acetylglucosamine synthase-like glycosyltransferase